MRKLLLREHRSQVAAELQRFAGDTWDDGTMQCGEEGEECFESRKS